MQFSDAMVIRASVFVLSFRLLFGSFSSAASVSSSAALLGLLLAMASSALPVDSLVASQSFRLFASATGSSAFSSVGAVAASPSADPWQRNLHQPPHCRHQSPIPRSPRRHHPTAAELDDAGVSSIAVFKDGRVRTECGPTSCSRQWRAARSDTIFLGGQGVLLQSRGNGGGIASPLRRPRPFCQASPSCQPLHGRLWPWRGWW